MQTLRSIVLLVPLLLYSPGCSHGFPNTSSDTSAIPTIPFEKNYQPGLLIPFANKWEGPGSIRLIPLDGKRTGTVWFRVTDAGVVVFARFSGGAPIWARSRIEMEQRDHVDIWLRTSLNVKLPEIAWGNQFGFETCEDLEGVSPARVENCHAWSVRQQEYRKPLARLFGRLWRMAPGVTAEERATGALTETLRYAADYEKETLAKLAPRKSPVFDSTEGVGFSYFETLIPWDAFPPSNTLSLDRIYIAIDIAHGRKLAATTSPRRELKQLPRLARLLLAKPHVSELTGCGYPLASGGGQGWYFPASASKISSSFRLDNEQQGYRYDPEGLSPIPVWTSYFEKPVANTEFVCGPDLRYFAGGKLFGPVGSIDQNTLSLRDAERGAHLLKSGPVVDTLSPFGSGECGSCLTVSITVFFLDPTRGITTAFNDSVMQGNGSHEIDGDIQLSPDWKTITVYRAKEAEPDPAVWSFERFCLIGGKYKQCGLGRSGPPPKPRQIDFGTGQ